MANKKPIGLKQLLANIPVIHRLFTITYKKEFEKEDALFLPLSGQNSPSFFINEHGKLYLSFSLNESLFNFDPELYQSAIKKYIDDQFQVQSSENFSIISKKSILKSKIGNTEFYTFIKELRKHFCYIKSDQQLWYLKNRKSKYSLPLNTMIITFAIMHRFSEIERYKPEQLMNIMDSKEKWILNEFLTSALDQFIDEIACELTGFDIMSTRTRS